ncbi:sensor histidine kinase [Streptantibioticus ferralitis]|uniref:Oxygen sensor histidine kinase NreB n=1 Tax=Streptantibioticus ferralitis TaxID=236510 RepID=A0ABT5YVS7_9ACTN|nr:sensor histidine kinase [Streptantibioticus ferralitis]MDF2255451.1 sensor histidine kinase [Streptantibioticus ferralitis]
MRTHTPVNTQVNAVDQDEDQAPEAGNRWFGLWDGYFAISYAVTTVLLFTTNGDQVRRAVAIGALTLAVPWYAALGRSLMLHNTVHRSVSRRNIVFGVGLFLLFAVATTFDISGSFALFAVVPMLMMALSTSSAIAVVLLANLMPVTVVWLTGGDIGSVLPTSLLGIALSVLLGLWIIRVVRQSRERGELIDELRRSREQLARLSHEAGISAERERLAREIHDTLAQGLTSIISLVQAAESEVTGAPELARQHLGLAGRVAKDSLVEAREFVAALTPPALRESSLVQAVRRQADGLVAETGLTVRCSVQGADRPLPMAVSVVLLRSVQEAFANVRKHARQARNVDVVLVYEEATVRLLVRDDGEGFQEQPVPRDGGGFGLRGMQARAREINGAAAVRSRPGQGTTIEVTVPVEPTGEG